jgi:glycosyltransferase involved in cell wall biosynthesis
MKIAFLTTDNREQLADYENPNPHFGTAPTALLEGFALLGNQVEVHVVSCAKKKMISPVKLAPNIWFHQPIVPQLGWGRTAFMGCGLAVRKLLKTVHPDLIHAQGTERDCAMAARLSSYPNVLTLHGNMRVHAAREENRGSLYYKLAAFLEGYCLKRTSGVVAISRYTEDLIKDLTPRTWLLPNAVDRRFFDITLEPQTIPRILFVGSINERKNPLGLLHACEPMLRAGECTLTFAGQSNVSSPYVYEFLKSAADLPGVELTGFIGRDELGEQFRCSSLLVLPTFEDNCPMVVLEAMAAGLPVAASRVGGVPDLITHEQDGLMFDPNNPATVKACIERLVKEPETRAQFGAAGRITAQKRFHPQVIAAAHLEIYRDVLGR